MTALANNLRASITDGAARAVAFRLTMASTVAMAVAFALSLDNPWWAAMAVWMIGQPPRGLLIERCAAQLVGTILGAIAGVALVLLGTKYSVASIAGLVLWIGICCGVANAMRHQRAYGAALCGLTSAVVVSLTLGTQVDPWGFALARVADSVIGIAASLLVAFIPGPILRGPSIGERARLTMADAIDLVAESLGDASKRTSEHERGFLTALAALEASSEDLAAGSLAGRRNLRDLNALLSLLLDLIVIARAIRHREGAVTAPGHAAMVRLRQAFKKTADRLRLDDRLEVHEIEVAALQLEATDALVSPVIAEMRSLLASLKAGHARLESSNRSSPQSLSLPHPDFAGLRVAALRGSLAVAVAGAGWLLIGWDPLRYLVLGTAIFTVLFSAADEPVPAVVQVLLGGLFAALAALLWREGIVPFAGSGWGSLGLAIPVVFIASLLQARKASMFLGLAFNMLFAVLARPVDIMQGTPLGLVAIEAMLLSGIALSYAFFRWFFPMHIGRRQEHLRTSIRQEIAAIGLRAGTPWAPRHLARLRFLVFSLSARSNGDVGIMEDALAALSVGHVLLRLGQDAGRSPVDAAPTISRRALDAFVPPMKNPVTVGNELVRLSREVDVENHIRWLLELAARELRKRPASFAVEPIA